MSRINNNKQAYGKTQGLINIFNEPIVAVRDPGVNDKADIGQSWVNKTLNTVWVLTSFLNGDAIWTETDNAGAATGITWTREAGAAVAMTNNHGYINAAAGLTTFTLPLVSPVGSVIEIIGEGAGGWRVSQNAGQYIRLNNNTSTVGVGGYIASAHAYTTIKLITRVANTVFEIARTNDNLYII